MPWQSGFLKGLMPTLVLSAVALASPVQKPKSWSFDSEIVDQVAAEFTSDVGDWTVVPDGSAPSKPNVLAQSAKNERPVFNVSLVRSTSYLDLDIEVKFKAIAGQIDQGGGVVWRALDPKNYYIARYNPLENNYRVYKVENGRRLQLGSADIKSSEGWHSLRVRMTGDQIECFYDGQKYLEVKDSSFREAGKIGLWTKADAQTHFDDLKVTGFNPPE